MFKEIKKIAGEVKGFTLTEVMIAMMILTVAIVSASNLLMGIISSNRHNLTSLQAYYFAQEGLEAVHNIRDTNWLHNRGWLGSDTDNIWGPAFEIPKNLSKGDETCTDNQDAENCYGIDVEAQGLTSQGLPVNGAGISGISYLKPWTVVKENGSEIYNDEGGKKKDTGFKRTIIIKKYDCSNLGLTLCPTDAKVDNYVLVQSKVEWSVGSAARDIVLSEVLSNWKGGVL